MTEVSSTPIHDNYKPEHATALSMPARYARLSEIAYSLPEERQARLNTLNLDNLYEIDPYFNSRRSFLAKSKDSNLAVIVNRGTSLQYDPVQDLATDAHIVANEKFRDSAHYKDAKSFADDVVKRYGATHKIVTTGHSLGGMTAFVLGNDLHIDSHSFNPGSSPLMAMKNMNVDGHNDFEFVSQFFRNNSGKLKDKNSFDRHFLYLTKGDVLSASAPFFKNSDGTKPEIFTNTPYKSRKPHDIENFFYSTTGESDIDW
jgi:Lipase (class 3)